MSHLEPEPSAADPARVRDPPQPAPASPVAGRRCPAETATRTDRSRAVPRTKTGSRRWPNQRISPGRVTWMRFSAPTGPRSVQSWPIWAAHNPTANVSPLRVDGLVQVAANRSGMSEGVELSGSLVRDVWADDGLWLVRARLGHGIPGSSGRTW